MLNPQQKQLIHSIEQLDVVQVQNILTNGLDPNFMDEEKGFPVSVLCDRLFVWWENICDAYEAGQPLPEEEKQQQLQAYQDILEALIQAKANLHIWDSEEFYGVLWDATSAACVPIMQRLLQENVNPNSKDDQGLTILSSISDLWFDCDFDEIDWNDALPEERAALQLLREHGAKMSKEL